jgi:hypothetical protein
MAGPRQTVALAGGVSAARSARSGSPPQMFTRTPEDCVAQVTDVWDDPDHSARRANGRPTLSLF